MWVLNLRSKPRRSTRLLHFNWQLKLIHVRSQTPLLHLLIKCSRFSLTSLWIILRFYGEEFFPEQSSWWFCRKLSTLGTKITQHTSILMRPLVSESSKTSKTPVSPIFQISKKQSQICQRLKTLSPNIEGKVTKESAKSHHLYWSFHCVQIEATARKGEILPFFTTAIKCKGVTSIPSFTTYTLILACCERRTKNARVTRHPAVEAIELVQVLPASL